MFISSNKLTQYKVLLKFRTLSQAPSSADHEHPPTLHSIKTKWITPSYPAAPATLSPQQRWVSCLTRQWTKWWMTWASKAAWRQARSAHGPQGGVRWHARPSYGGFIVYCLPFKGLFSSSSSSSSSTTTGPCKGKSLRFWCYISFWSNNK